jgi:hypothetical protein
MLLAASTPPFHIAMAALACVIIFGCLFSKHGAKNILEKNGCQNARSQIAAGCVETQPQIGHET